MRLRARWLFPGNGPPLRNAVITIDGEQICSVEEHSTQTDARDLGNVALIPGLINTHTHLEFSDLPVPLEPRRHFAEWIQAVIFNRRERSSDPAIAIGQGLRESLAQGVIGLAETATSDWILERSVSQQSSPGNVISAMNAPRITAFREILGLQHDGVAAQLEVAVSFLKRAAEMGMMEVGLSPHAPYSLHPLLFRGLCDLATTQQVPLSMHLAESPAEIELLQTGTGPLVDLFTQMKIWQPGVIPLKSRPLGYLEELARAPRVLVIHGNLLDEKELKFLADRPHMSVAYCPRTHHAMQAGPHPWRRMLHLGIRLTLGTDSRASNPDLSLWRELQFLKSQAPDLPASQLLALATSNAARALGWPDLGVLAPGFKAVMCCVPLTADGIDTPEHSLFDRDVLIISPGQIF